MVKKIQQLNLSKLKSIIGKILYKLYFQFVILFLREGSNYILVDIDNTVTVPGERLSEYVEGNFCNYKKANRFRALINDPPIDGANIYLDDLSNQYPIIWFTARSIFQIIGTYIWFIKNGFPIRITIFTNTILRKIEFLEMFKEKCNIYLIIDDMKVGYEFGNPEYFEPYKNFLEGNDIRHIEYLPFDYQGK